MRSPSLSAVCGHLSPGRTTSTLPLPGGILWDAAGRPGIKGFCPFCAHWYMKFICHCYFIKPVYMVKTVIYFFFTNGCLCIFFYIAHFCMLFECTLSSFLFRYTRVSKIYLSVKLFVWKMAFILITLGLIWFIFGLYTFLRVFVGYTLTFNNVSRSRL